MCGYLLEGPRERRIKDEKCTEAKNDAGLRKLHHSLESAGPKASAGVVLQPQSLVGDGLPPKDVTLTWHLSELPWKGLCPNQAFVGVLGGVACL